jgi:Family of unknown function (DUF6788)
MSSTILRKKLCRLASDYGRLLRQILRHEQMLRGSFHQVYTRCGKENCWCAKAKHGHPHTRLTWSEAGVMITRKVGTSERKAVGKLTGAYKHFSQQRQELAAFHQKIHAQLDAYEDAVITQSRKPLGLLPRKGTLPTKTKSSLQKRRCRQNPDQRKSFSP